MSKLAKRVRKFVIAVAATAVVAVSVYADHTPTVTARAKQHPVNQSGVKGRIEFTSVPGGLLVTGTATGLEPSVGRYVSLVYDLPSVPGGPTVCEPVEEIDGMFVGIWAVGALGNGILLQLVPANQVAPLSIIDTISIRDTTINDGFGPEAVVACGEIAVHGGR
ncbi:MAG: hypothetical protein WAU45_09595 [Blastocatellia bacterium]